MHIYCTYYDLRAWHQFLCVATYIDELYLHTWAHLIWLGNFTQFAAHMLCHAVASLTRHYIFTTCNS